MSTRGHRDRAIRELAEEHKPPDRNDKHQREALEIVVEHTAQEDEKGTQAEHDWFPCRSAVGLGFGFVLGRWYWHRPTAGVRVAVAKMAAAQNEDTENSEEEEKGLCNA